VTFGLLVASDRFAPPGERPDVALRVGLLALGRPGAGVVAYLRFDPICLG